MDEIEVPSLFLCPISLELMRDPVTVTTGMTYDRESIERWLFSSKSNNTCPITKQLLSDTTLTPNHTLRRLIQAWCTLNASHGVERIPTPKPPVDKAQIVKLLDQAAKQPQMQTQLKCLKRLKSIVFESARNKRCLEEAGAVEFLASVIKKNKLAAIETPSESESDFARASDEALTILYNINASETTLNKLVTIDREFVESLVEVMKCGKFQSRAYSTMLLKSIFEIANPTQLIAVTPELFAEIVRILRDQISHQCSKAALKLLVGLCPWGRNRVKAVEAGAVPVLIEILLDAFDRRTCEPALVVLDVLCSCAEGREELLRHGAGVAVVSKIILRISHVASDRAVRILCSVCRYSGNCRVLQEMLQVGAVSKLCLVLQVDSSLKTKERAREILKLHSRVWRSSPCISSHLLYSYPVSS